MAARGFRECATTSPPSRVESAWRVGRSAVLVSVRKRTEPSQKAKLAPPVCPLPNAQTRGSVTRKLFGLLPTGQR